MSRKQRVAVVGLGSMGLGMALSLVRAGHEVRGVDVNPGAVARLVDAGGTAADTPRAAATGAEVAVIVVVTAAQVDTVLDGPDGVLAGMDAGGTVMACPTMSPDDARRIAAKVQAAGLHYIDAPISGGAARAEQGQLTIMASGAPAAFAAARPSLDAMAATVYELGDEAGIGAAFKIVNQLLAGVHIAAACEAITFAKSMGLDIARVYEVIRNSAGNSWMFENRVPHVLDGDYHPRSATAIFTKDLGIVTDIGRAGKFPLPVASTALQLFVMTEAAGMGRDDDASVARLFAQIAGLDLPGPGREQT